MSSAEGEKSKLSLKGVSIHFSEFKKEFMYIFFFIQNFGLIPINRKNSVRGLNCPGKVQVVQGCVVTGNTHQENVKTGKIKGTQEPLSPP